MPGASNPAVTEARRRILLWVLWIHGAQTPGSLTALIEAHVRNDNLQWPKADWAGARKMPYYAGTNQMLNQMVEGPQGWRRSADPVEAQTGRVLYLPDQHLYEWNPKILPTRKWAEEVLGLRRKGHSNKQIADLLGIAESRASEVYFDPFGLREKDRKQKYCPHCGTPKQPEQTRCVGCVRRKREKVEDDAEALLPDPEWAHALSLLMPVDFCVTDNLERWLHVHTERGKIELRLVRGETWAHAVERAGAVR